MLENSQNNTWRTRGKLIITNIWKSGNCIGPNLWPLVTFVSFNLFNLTEKKKKNSIEAFWNIGSRVKGVRERHVRINRRGGFAFVTYDFLSFNFLLVVRASLAYSLLILFHPRFFSFFFFLIAFLSAFHYLNVTICALIQNIFLKIFRYVWDNIFRSCLAGQIK